MIFMDEVRTIEKRLKRFKPKTAREQELHEAAKTLLQWGSENAELIG